MPFNCSVQERDFFSKIGAIADILNIETYVVGGFVRDKILGRPTKDIDIVCVGKAEVLAEQYKRCFDQKAGIQYFKNFGTLQLKTKHITAELVSARKESYAAHSRKPEVRQGSFLEDQQRRDFTINTLALSLNTAHYFQLIDTFNGLSDLEQKIIRTPLSAEKTFSDDPLRMLRGARFATQLNFSIHPDTLSAIQNTADRLAIISQERIIEELHKILLCPRPSQGLLLLDKMTLLERILPEITHLKGVEYIEGKGHKDNFYHSLEVLDNLAVRSDKLYLRWAALLHDIGKSRTKIYHPKSGWTFHMHEFIGAKMAEKCFRRLKLPLQDAAYVKKIIALHHRPISLTKAEITDSAIRRLLFDAGADLDDLMLLCHADITSKNERKVKQYRANFEAVRKRLTEVEEKDKIRNWQPPVSGALIMEIFGLKPCKEVGLIKTAIREAILDGKIANTREAALEWMYQAAADILSSASTTAS